jgi:hypothetical protein
VTRGRPRTAIGTFGEIAVTDLGGRYRALTRYRDLDGRLRKVTAVAGTPRAAAARLKARLTGRPGYGSGGVLGVAGGFGELCELWLADLEVRDISEGTKTNYRDDLRLHVRPAFDAYTLGEVTTGRVEWFLKRRAATSYSRARHLRTLLNQMFAFALRHDASSQPRRGHLAIGPAPAPGPRPDPGAGPGPARRRRVLAHRTGRQGAPAGREGPRHLRGATGHRPAAGGGPRAAALRRHRDHRRHGH